MSGTDIVGALLRAYPALTAVVPVAQIKAGALPDGIPLPALLVRTVSSIDWQPLKLGATNRTIDRTSVTVRAASYREQCAIIKLVAKCCAGRVGDIGGALRVAILTAGKGPDMAGPANSFEQTQDFRVSFDAPT